MKYNLKLNIGGYNYFKFNIGIDMKKIVFIMTVILSIGLADTTDEGIKAYKSGEYQKAEDLFKKACEDKNMDGCNNLGAIYENIHQDYQKAAKLYQKACDGGYALACTNLAGLYEPHELDEKEALHKKACMGGAMIGCYNLGYIYEQKAILLYKMVCDEKINLGCDNYNRLKDNHQ